MRGPLGGLKRLWHHQGATAESCHNRTLLDRTPNWGLVNRTSHFERHLSSIFIVHRTVLPIIKTCNGVNRQLLVEVFDGARTESNQRNLVACATAKSVRICRFWASARNLD